MRYREPVDHFGVAHLLGLIDGWPPAITPMFTRPTPVSTLSWTVDLLETPDPSAGSDFWQYSVHSDGSAHGYAHSHAHVWDPAGSLVAISRQTVAVFG